MSYIKPSKNDFKTYFFRDFSFGTNPKDLTQVQDQDLTRALQQASMVINEGLFPSQDAFTNGFLLLMAHNLVVNLQMSSQGVAGQYDWLTNSKGVGGVSASFNIPPRIANSPMFAMYCKTAYGANYLSMIYPYLVGVMYNVGGQTHA